MSRVIALLTVALACGGCARMVVTKDPKPHDKGIRFYRPKPYLFIGPAGGAVSSSSDKGGGDKGDVPPQEALPPPPPEEAAQATSYIDGAPAKAKVAPTNRPVLTTVPVTMHIEYLPDYSEEYSIRVTPGLGQAELNVQLQNGWNLNSVDAKTDQKYAEIIGSVASLVGAVGKPGAKDVVPQPAQAESNVPLGYYEAVIAVNECGRKEMLGWRYVGFMPCFTCPVKACVHRDQVTCDDESMYALVFEGGTLRMKKMAEMKGPGDANLNCANCPHCHAATATDEDGSGGFTIEGQGGRVRQ